MQPKSLSEAAHLLGVPRHRIVYAHMCGAVTEPLRVCGRRAYGTTDLKRLEDYFETKKTRKEAHVSLQADDANANR